MVEKELSCDEEVSFACVGIEIGGNLGNLILNVNSEVGTGLPFLCNKNSRLNDIQGYFFFALSVISII